jgi:hypothetical protein
MTIGDSYEFTVICLDTSITGTQENAAEHVVASPRTCLVPTLFRDDLVIKILGPLPATLDVRLIDSSGKIVYSRSCAKLQPVITLDKKTVGSLPGGVYFLFALSDGRAVYRNKLVKIE